MSRRRQDGDTVDACGRLRVQQFGTRRQEIPERADLAALAAGFDPAGPAGDEGHARAAFENEVLPAAQTVRGMVAVRVFERVVEVAVKEDGAVVTAEEQESVFGEVEAVEGVHDLSGFPVNLADNIAANAAFAAADKTRRGRAWDVRLEHPDVKEERVVLMLFDECHGFRLRPR